MGSAYPFRRVVPIVPRARAKRDATIDAPLRLVRHALSPFRSEWDFVVQIAREAAAVAAGRLLPVII